VPLLILGVLTHFNRTTTDRTLLTQDVIQSTTQITLQNRAELTMPPIQKKKGKKASMRQLIRREESNETQGSSVSVANIVQDTLGLPDAPTTDPSGNDPQYPTQAPASQSWADMVEEDLADQEAANTLTALKDEKPPPYSASTTASPSQPTMSGGPSRPLYVAPFVIAPEYREALKQWQDSSITELLFREAVKAHKVYFKESDYDQVTDGLVKEAKEKHKQSLIASEQAGKELENSGMSLPSNFPMTYKQWKEKSLEQQQVLLQVVSKFSPDQHHSRQSLNMGQLQILVLLTSLFPQNQHDRPHGSGAALLPQYQNDGSQGSGGAVPPRYQDDSPEGSGAILPPQNRHDSPQGSKATSPLQTGHDSPQVLGAILPPPQNQHDTTAYAPYLFPKPSHDPDGSSTLKAPLDDESEPEVESEEESDYEVDPPLQLSELFFGPKLIVRSSIIILSGPNEQELQNFGKDLQANIGARASLERLSTFCEHVDILRAARAIRSGLPQNQREGRVFILTTLLLGKKKGPKFLRHVVDTALDLSLYVYWVNVMPWTRVKKIREVTRPDAVVDFKTVPLRCIAFDDTYDVTDCLHRICLTFGKR
jgi:hypothetical protein